MDPVGSVAIQDGQSRNDFAAAFVRKGPAIPQSPVILSVPHAGRAYPPALLDGLAVPARHLLRLEDRHADCLAQTAIARGYTVFIAEYPRAGIDLNRSEREVDSAMLADPPRQHGFVASAKVRAGLGLFPARLTGAGALWRRRLPLAEAEARIAGVHRSWHDALSGALDLARARFGTALLLDLHSMPPVRALPEGERPGIVIGDRFGRSAADRLVERALASASAAGLRVARNTPYSGGYTLERHGRPERQVHAIQIEVDRSLYLDAALESPTGASARIAAMLRDLADDLCEELTGRPMLEAAE